MCCLHRQFSEVECVRQKNPKINAVRLKIPLLQHTTGVSTTGCTSAILVGLCCCNPPLAAVYGGGVLGYNYANAMDVSCCYSLPTVTIHCRVLATTAVRSLQQQWLLPENDASTYVWVRDISPITLPSLFHHRRIPTMAVQHLSLPYQRGLSPSPHRTSPCTLLLVSAGLQKGWLHKHGPSPPRPPFVLSAPSTAWACSNTADL